MTMAPTKNLEAAIKRLTRAATEDGLVSIGRFNYGGSIAGDLLAVLRIIERHAVKEKA